MFYPLRVAVHAPRRKRFEARSPLTLPGLLADPGLRTSFLKNRSFGPGIYAVVQQARPTHAYSEFAEAFRMLLADRLDYLVEFHDPTAASHNLTGEAEELARQVARFSVGGQSGRQGQASSRTHAGPSRAVLAPASRRIRGAVALAAAVPTVEGWEDF